MQQRFPKKDKYTLDDLIAIMTILRGEGGCPWDREQTHRSIRKDLIEETYEVAEAIDREDPDLLKEELGDLLLQVVFHSRISEEAGEFSLHDVADGICKKLIVRHPHIFADIVVHSSDEVMDNWDEIKKREKGQTTAAQTLHSVPAVLPALIRSAKVQKRAGKAGFDYPDVHMALADLHSELEEFKEALQSGDRDEYQDELGDILFSVVNVARLLKMDPEESLSMSCNKFIKRFEKLEALTLNRHIDMKKSTLEQLNALWQEAKSL
jgi:tetrapyrrole methylase family protein/MazG family protein